MRYESGSMPPGPEIGRHTTPAPSPNQRGVRTEPDGAKLAALDAALASGDHGRALALIDDCFGAGLFRFIFALVRRADLADDLYQTTLLEAFRDLGRFDGRSTLRTWLFSIARHRCLDALKRARRRGDQRVPIEPPDKIDSTPGADHRLGEAQLHAALGRCLDHLAPEIRMVLVMRFSEGFGYDEIARISGISAEAARARVSRALPVLRRCLAREGAL